MILSPATDPCPTGVNALGENDRRNLPLLPWFAARRQADSFHGKLADFYAEAMADIELMGLLRQAEAKS